MAENVVAGQLGFPRVWDAGRLHWMPVKTPAGAVGAGLNGTGVRAVSRTSRAHEAYRVLGGITDLDASFVTLSDASGRSLWSNTDTLIKQFFGKKRLVRNYLDFRPPFLLEEGNNMVADALGAGAETGGNLVFLAEPLAAKKITITIPESAYPFQLVLPAGLAGSANERRTVETTRSRTHHTLIWGGGTDLTTVSIRIKDAEGQNWSDDPVPIWSVFADPNSASQIIRQDWPRPYHLPPGAALEVEFTNPASGAEAHGFIYFNCSRWQ